MSGREFVDTNVLLYAFDHRTPHKQEVAAKLMEAIVARGSGCLSVQVLQEFYVSLTRKLGVDPAEALDSAERLARWPVDAPTGKEVLAAIHLHRNQMISFWDALIVGSAQRQNCHTLWTEDLNDGQQFGAVTVRNPFRSI